MVHSKILRGLSYLTLALYVFTSMPFLGGMVILIKTGGAPEGLWWSEIPAMTLALATVLAQSLVGERILNAEMPWFIRSILAIEWVLVFVVFCVTLPLYMIASQLTLSLPKTVALIEREGTITYWIMFAIIASVELGVVAILAAAGYDKSHAKAQADEKATVIASGIGPNQRAILEAMIVASAHIQQTVEVLVVSADPPLNESQVRVGLKALIESGQVKDVGGRPKSYELRGEQ